jgi:hypothetical protein
MTLLASALDEMASEPLDGDVVSGADLVALFAARARLEGELLRRLRVWDDHEAWAADGALSPSGWLAHECRVLPSSARRLVHLAHRLGDAPLTEAALRAGVVSRDQATILARASAAPCSARFQADEAVLLGQAHQVTAGQLVHIVRHWRQHAEAEATADAADVEPGYAGRHLYASVTWDGTVAVDGVLDAAGGAVVVAALDAAMEADRGSPAEDTRRRPQRRADALALICRHYLDTANIPSSGGERPHLAVTVDLAALTGSGSGRTDHGVPLTAATIRQLACDASLHPIFTRGSELLDIGRRTRIVPAALRRALVARDGGCRFPGCDRAASWCDAHHIRFWTDGGSTSLPNLLLLCRRHHRLLHHGWALSGTATAPTFTRPDGTVLSSAGDVPTAGGADPRAGPGP